MGNFTGISVQNSVAEEKLLGVAVTDHRWGLFRDAGGIALITNQMAKDE
jgi:hypothetical protein